MPWRKRQDHPRQITRFYGVKVIGDSAVVRCHLIAGIHTFREFEEPAPIPFVDEPIRIGTYIRRERRNGDAHEATLGSERTFGFRPLRDRGHALHLFVSE